MAMIIGVRFREVGRVYFFDPGDVQVKHGDRVIVETARGIECGEVVQENADVPEEEIKRPLKKMIRIATDEDLRNLENKARKEEEAFKVCEEKILKHGLDMKLVNVEYTFDASKIIFHFTADQRVDFRALVRDLAGQFRTRIELRQIGVRDEAKLLGGLGVCGRPFCCSLFMGDFHPVSIKMAKEQGLSLNPSKISGTCGRLMCCLKYEEVAYEDALKELPKPGSYVDTPDGRGMVTEVNAISRAVRVKLERRPDAAPQTFQHTTLDGLKRKAVLRDENDIFAAEPVLKSAQPAPEPAKQPGQEQRPHQQQHQQHRQKKKPAPLFGDKHNEKHNEKFDRQEKHVDKQKKADKLPAAEEKQATTDKQKPKADKPNKSWRERHAPKKQEPAYRQTAEKPAAPTQERKQPAADAKAVPRYGEVRRANAPQPPKQQSSNYRRQPWQKKNETQGKKSDK